MQYVILHMVDSAGFEPAASGLQSQRSYQLSYEPEVLEMTLWCLSS
jgi:hypothetical protein